MFLLCYRLILLGYIFILHSYITDVILQIYPPRLPYIFTLLSHIPDLPYPFISQIYTAQLHDLFTLLSHIPDLPRSVVKTNLVAVGPRGTAELDARVFLPFCQRFVDFTSLS